MERGRDKREEKREGGRKEKSRKDIGEFVHLLLCPSILHLCSEHLFNFY